MGEQTRRNATQRERSRETAAVLKTAFKQREATKVKTRRGSKNDEACCVLNERTRETLCDRDNVHIYDSQNEDRNIAYTGVCRNRKRLRNVD